VRGGFLFLPESSNPADRITKPEVDGMEKRWLEYAYWVEKCGYYTGWSRHRWATEFEYYLYLNHDIVFPTCNDATVSAVVNAVMTLMLTTEYSLNIEGMTPEAIVGIMDDEHITTLIGDLECLYDIKIDDDLILNDRSFATIVNHVEEARATKH
jgi:hypothetical protein